MKQVDLEGEDVGEQVAAERKVTVSMHLGTEHFELRASVDALRKIRQEKSAAAKEAKLLERIRARARVKEIPPGAWEVESRALVEAALTLPLEAPKVEVAPGKGTA